MSKRTPKWAQLRVSFERRYKWAIPLVNSNTIYGRPVAIPDFEAFIKSYEKTQDVRVLHRYKMLFLLTTTETG